MNDTQAAELVTLEAIFCESFKRLGEDAFSFDFESTFYKAAFHVEARFSPDYPATPLARLEVSSPETHEEVVRMVVAKLRDIEREMVNPDLPYVYNLVSAMDEEQYQIADIGAETQRLHE